MDSTVIQRMRQRKIVQWTIAYLAAGWVLVQVFHLVGQQFNWPAPILRATTVLLAFGVLPAVVVAWYHGEQGAQHVTRREGLLLVALFAVGGSLAWWVARPVPEEPIQLVRAANFSPTRIAVLPFDDFSPERDQQFLGDGIADTLVRVFAGIEELSVIARASAFAYRGRDIATIARDLEVGSVLEGSVQRAGDRLRIVAQLVRTADQSQVWSLSFERPAGDIFAIQDEIAAQVVDALPGAEVLGIERRRLERTNTDAYDLYLQGRELWQLREGAMTRRAVEVLEQAVALDPQFAPARSELATALYFAPDLGRLEKLPRVEAEIEQALLLDPQDAQAHAIRGLLLLVEGRLAESRTALRQGLEFRPNDVNILSWLADSYATAGMQVAAGRYNRRAFELDPMNVFARTRMVNQLLAEDSPESLVLARQTVRLFPDSQLAWGTLIRAYEHRGELAAAVLAAVDALDHAPEHESLIFRIALIFKQLGDQELAERWRARIPGYQSWLGAEFQWLLIRGDVQATLDLARERMARFGETPATLAWYGRALLTADQYDEAWSVLNRVFEAGPDFGTPANVSWGQAEIPVLLAGVALRRGERAHAEQLERLILPLIEAADSPLLANARMFSLDLAMGRFESAAARLAEIPFDPMIPFLIRHVEWWAELGATPAGRMYIDEMERESARQLQRLRETDIPWLLEPEQWTPK